MCFSWRAAIGGRERQGQRRQRKVTYVCARGRTHLEVLDDDGKRCREERHLTRRRAEGEQLLHDGLELWAEQLVGLVHDERRALAQVGDALSGQVEDPPGGADEDVHGLGEAHDVVLERRAASGDHDVGAEVLAERLGHLRRLERELARGDEQERLDLGPLGVELLQGRDNERRRLARAVLGLRERRGRVGRGRADCQRPNGRGKSKGRGRRKQREGPDARGRGRRARSGRRGWLPPGSGSASQTRPQRCPSGARA